MHLKPVGTSAVLKDQVYDALRSAIIAMDVYADDADTKLDERRLAEGLGVSRTPVREALSRLVQEGLVQMIPRRGAFVVRKTKREIMEKICVWGALECRAARLAVEHAGNDEIANLRRRFATPGDAKRGRVPIDERSDENIRFHRGIIRLGRCELITEITEGLFAHMHAIRVRPGREREPGSSSLVDHQPIIEALESRDGSLAEKLVREHADHLVELVRKHATWLE
jgi:DNA-binding GntR family transcriptional regulator